MNDPVLATRPLDSLWWATADPFLFCAHHHDAYPAGNEQMGPAASLAGRNIGQDFQGRDGWRMYHGDVVPGFPPHPHRGFETVTIVRQGFVDHADSLGAAARFGAGDVQWVTAGGGIVHSEMFPLRDPSGPNPVELFQIWLNLPASDKLVEPHFAMLWREQVPVEVVVDPDGRRTEVSVIAGRFGASTAPSPPPRSWAARPEADVAIWSIRAEPGAAFELPPARAGTHRTLYAFGGRSLRVGGRKFPSRVGLELRADVPVAVENGPEAADLLLLQGRPIGEPVAQHGPFVMNTPAEIRQAFADYQRTRFGGWPWPSGAPVHPRAEGRFARHGDGRVERPEAAPAK